VSGKIRFFAALFVALLGSRLCHVRILWTDGDYHLAAAMQLAAGRTLYRDLWYDKPPLNALAYFAMGTPTGWALAVATSLYLLAGCFLIYLLAKYLWGEREGVLAAGLLAFSLIFYLPAAVMSLAPDLFLLVPQLAAVYLAVAGYPVAAGALAGIGFGFNVKAIFVLAICLFIGRRSAFKVIFGFAGVTAVVTLALWLDGSFKDYWEQVWVWGAAYAAKTPVAGPWSNGVSRTLNWIGFHSAIAVAAAWFWWRDRTPARVWIGVWALLSLIGVAVGLRFLPRYYFQLLPAIVLAASRGFATMGKAHPAPLVRMLAVSLLLIPVIRFAPRYVILAHDLVTGVPHHWADIVLDQDSQAAARIVAAQSRPGDTLFVWGYRPSLYVYTRVPAGSKFWDSQPVSGVPAERHFETDVPIVADWAARNQKELALSHPTFVVDTLSSINPALNMGRYPELRSWLSDYKLVGRTRLTTVYQRK
jgi:hypothetical protein